MPQEQCRLDLDAQLSLRLVGHRHMLQSPPEGPCSIGRTRRAPPCSLEGDGHAITVPRKRPHDELLKLVYRNAAKSVIRWCKSRCIWMVHWSS
jgi:hypothetical protein